MEETDTNTVQVSHKDEATVSIGADAKDKPEGFYNIIPNKVETMTEKSKDLQVGNPKCMT